MPSPEQARKSAIEYRNSQLLKIIKQINPDYPLGDGMKASIKHHRAELEKLGA